MVPSQHALPRTIESKGKSKNYSVLL